MTDKLRRAYAEALWPPAKVVKGRLDEDDFCRRHIMPTVDRIQRIRDADLESWRERAEKAEAAIARVRAAHPMVNDAYGPECRGCGNPAAGIVSWPCPTIAALDDTRKDGRHDQP